MTNKYMYFIANWKMFGDLRTLNSLDSVIKFSKIIKNTKFRIVYCPPNTLIRPLSKRLKKTNLEVGAQNCHESENYGAYTGHVNSKMLKNVGAKYVILGHSENRQSGETDKLINLKIKSAIKSNLKVIFCIGETLSEKRKKITNKVLAKQIINGLKSIKNNSNIIIAYEPVWSIGTGLIPKSNDLLNSISYIKSKFNKKTPKVLYGGSVNDKNIAQLKDISVIDGFLIGGASQSSKKFIDIIKKTFN
ncbi:triose-phosphate isomerase [Candidatus Pelagibacter bacterium nBUS_49]|uniref:triose-phosphate isomerase n=1 Tax=Candidatus Pelagibacter bacterium nBUS_49 TaxID=3374196 RepID=UPI003EBBC1F5